MNNEQKFLARLSVQERNGVNYFMRVYNVSVQEAYKILKGEIDPQRVHETPEPVPPPADPAKPEPVTRKEYQCQYCGKKYKLNSHNRSMVYCSFCIKEGLHYLHLQFGSTNGWDKKPKETSAKIEPGWRGRVVISPGPSFFPMRALNS